MKIIFQKSAKRLIYNQWKERFHHHWQSMKQPQDWMVFNMGQESYRRSRGSMLTRYWAAEANHMKPSYSITGTDFRKIQFKVHIKVWLVSHWLKGATKEATTLRPKFLFLAWKLFLRPLYMIGLNLLFPTILNFSIFDTK